MTTVELSEADRHALVEVTAATLYDRRHHVDPPCPDLDCPAWDALPPAERVEWLRNVKHVLDAAVEAGIELLPPVTPDESVDAASRAAALVAWRDGAERGHARSLLERIYQPGRSS